MVNKKWNRDEKLKLQFYSKKAHLDVNVMYRTLYIFQLYMNSRTELTKSIAYKAFAIIITANIHLKDSIHLFSLELIF